LATPNDDPLTLVSAEPTSVQGGTIVIGSDRSLRYTSPVDFVGIDTFRYVVSNSFGQESTITVSVEVSLLPVTSPVDEPLPVIPMIAAPLAALVAEPQDRELPATGSNPDDMLALAFALVAAGAVLLWSRRSNRTS
ncbi:MAG: hypothetical protein QOF21_2972, partial [Actinomycetota bacterium]